MGSSLNVTLAWIFFHLVYSGLHLLPISVFLSQRSSCCLFTVCCVSIGGWKPGSWDIFKEF